MLLAIMEEAFVQECIQCLSVNCLIYYSFNFFSFGYYCYFVK